MDHDGTIATIVDALKDERRISALFLSGSHGTGLNDAYSDIDFLMVAAEGATDGIAALWRDAIAGTGDIVLWWDRQVRPALINAITDDWTRTDVVILKPDQMRGQTQDRLRVLFDHDGLFDTLVPNAAPPRPDPRRIGYQINEFIRILGLLPLAIGRGEYLNGVTGICHLRGLLTDLLIEETGAANRGGALNLNRIITDEQKAVLAGLPLPPPEREPLIAAHLAYAAAYLPRARTLAQRHELLWPEAFERATWRRLEDTLSVTPPVLAR